uniref:Uncharacterized protein n=1 Tax=Setaria viridis TaxID=4556 RepID=A0A4U6WDC2_SETVI|nr:hypothetical protein SEVIR_1G199800v2 [Setaria viridis]
MQKPIRSIGSTMWPDGAESSHPCQSQATSPGALHLAPTWRPRSWTRGGGASGEDDEVPLVEKGVAKGIGASLRLKGGAWHMPMPEPVSLLEAIVIATVYCVVRTPA